MNEISIQKETQETDYKKNTYKIRFRKVTEKFSTHAKNIDQSD